MREIRRRTQQKLEETTSFDGRRLSHQLTTSAGHRRTDDEVDQRIGVMGQEVIVVNKDMSK